MLKILQARLQPYVNWEPPEVEAEFRKNRGTRVQIANIHWIIKKTRAPEKNLLYWLYQSLWLCGSQQTVENFSRDGNTRPPYLPPEKSVCRSRRNRIRRGTTDWFQIGKGVRQDCIYCHLAYLTSMQSTSCEMPGWMKHKLERGEWKSWFKTQH